MTLRELVDLVEAKIENQELDPNDKVQIWDSTLGLVMVDSVRPTSDDGVVIE